MTGSGAHYDGETAAPQPPSGAVRAGVAPESDPGKPAVAPEDHFWAVEAEFLRGSFAGAGVILDYGMGGAAMLAAGMEGKTLISVHSDPEWVGRVQAGFAAAPPKARVLLRHADIGPVKEWGMPRTDRFWRRFHHYPLAVWDDPDFQHPDCVVIHGRFRLGCLLASALRCRRPVTVLFDNYTTRAPYGDVERLIQPDEIVGRMAVYRLVPREFPVRQLSQIMELMTRSG